MKIKVKTRRGWARPFVPFYAAALATKNALRSHGVLKTRSLAWPVISVGSLSAGGAGKTPVVIALAKLLREQGWSPDVLSRGYGRSSGGVKKVDGADPVLQGLSDGAISDESLLTTGEAAKRFGDEPVLIARATHVPVWVGSSRFAAGQKAEKEAAGVTKGVHILDDGFQHQQLARQINAVLVTTEDLDDKLLPAGNLRETRKALIRADVVVIREKEFKRVGPRVRRFVHGAVAVWLLRRTVSFPQPLGVLSAGLRPVAFCAIARPQDFAAMLVDAGCGTVDTVAFADHHPYTLSDIEQIVSVAEKRKASGFVTTEKDAVKLTPALRARLETVGPVVVVTLNSEFIDEPAVVRYLQGRLP